eukprot:1424357-Pyramimonas_sp.AAC.1
MFVQSGVWSTWHQARLCSATAGVSPALGPRVFGHPRGVPPCADPPRGVAHPLARPRSFGAAGDHPLLCDRDVTVGALKKEHFSLGRGSAFLDYFTACL